MLQLLLSIYLAQWGGYVTRVCLWSRSRTNFTNSPIEIMNQTNPVKSRFIYY